MLVKEIIRQNSLYKLGLSDKPKVLNILERLKDLNQFKDGAYTDYIFWCKSKNDIYMEQDLNNDCFYINYDKIWSVLESDFGLNYTDIQLLTKWYIETTYDLKGVTNLLKTIPTAANIETTYDLKGVTNKYHFHQWLSCIETTYDLKGVTTSK